MDVRVWLVQGSCKWIVGGHFTGAEEKVSIRKIVVGLKPKQINKTSEASDNDPHLDQKKKMLIQKWPKVVRAK